MEEKPTKQRGGYRDGAGRKPKGGVGSRRLSMRINKEHHKLIAAHYKSVSGFIDTAIEHELEKDGLL